MSKFENVKLCGLPHGSCSNLHTPLRGGQQATIYFDRLRCEEGNLGKSTVLVKGMRNYVITVVSDTQKKR